MQTRGVSTPFRFEDLPGRPCPIAASLDVVGERWSLLVVREIALGNHRFSQIARGTGAPRDRLSARLRALVAAGVVDHREDGGYHLTGAGKDLIPALQMLLQWGNRWLTDEPPVVLEHRPHEHADHALDGEWVCRTCGEPVAPADVRRVLTPAGRRLTAAADPGA